eukprot:CCRYP_019452-RA/>CCRYP_019452-RA protein AED:0.28 eAED:0.28 QI:0/0.5/0.33/1/0.5/0.33/3/266/79
MEEDVFHEEQYLIKVIGTIDNKKAHDICVVTHGQGQATVAQRCYKPQRSSTVLGCKGLVSHRVLHLKESSKAVNLRLVK